RAALWETEKPLPEPLFCHSERSAAESKNPVMKHKGNVTGSLDVARDDQCAALMPMTLPERVRADFETMNLTTGPHPMKLLRNNLPNIWSAIDLANARHGATVQIAGNVI